MGRSPAKVSNSPVRSGVHRPAAARACTNSACREQLTTCRQDCLALQQQCEKLSACCKELSDTNKTLHESTHAGQQLIDQAHEQALELCLRQCEQQVAAVQQTEHRLSAQKIAEAQAIAAASAELDTRASTREQAQVASCKQQQLVDAAAELDTTMHNRIRQYEADLGTLRDQVAQATQMRDIARAHCIQLEHEMVSKLSEQEAHYKSSLFATVTRVRKEEADAAAAELHEQNVRGLSMVKEQVQEAREQEREIAAVTLREQKALCVRLCEQAAATARGKEQQTAAALLQQQLDDASALFKQQLSEAKVHESRALAALKGETAEQTLKALRVQANEEAAKLARALESQKKELQDTTERRLHEVAQRQDRECREAVESVRWEEQANAAALIHSERQARKEKDARMERQMSDSVSSQLQQQAAADSWKRDYELANAKQRSAREKLLEREKQLAATPQHSPIRPQDISRISPSLESRNIYQPALVTPALGGIKEEQAQPLFQLFYPRQQVGERLSEGISSDLRSTDLSRAMSTLR